MNTEIKVSYPFSCKNCGLLVKRKRKGKAHKNGKCRNKCDGIKKDYGGYPLDPILRKQFIKAKEDLRKAKMRVKNILKDDPNFYDSKEWLELRYKVLKKYGGKCQLCGDQKYGLHVDHIKPRSKFPELELEESN